jgi:predicted phage terminase large subunit-like protein
VAQQNWIGNLSEEEQAKLKALIAELKSRGIKIPQSSVSPQKKSFKMDSSGFFMKQDGTKYNPSEAQRNFIMSNAVFIGFGGSRGSGKTSAGAQKAMRKIADGQSGVVANPDFENLKISTWRELKEWLPWDLVVPSHRYRKSADWEPHQPFMLTFLNGAKVIVKGIKDPNSARGPNVNWFWYDEAQRDLTGEAWKIAVASVRVGNNPQSWATFTPSGKEHWTYKLFVEQEIAEDALKMFEEGASDRNLVEFYHGTIYDNQANLDPGYMAAMLAAYPSGWLRQQEVLGEFVSQEGTLGDRSWFNGKFIPLPPDNVRGRVRYWDLAATEKKMSGKRNDPDETVGTKMSWDGTNFYIEHQVGGYWAWDDIKDIIVQTALQDGIYTKIYVEQEPGAGGKNQVAELASYVSAKLPAHPRIEGHRPEGDKVMRANTWFAEAKAGNIFIVSGEWNSAFLDQLDCFNQCLHDDRIDSVSGARYCLAPIRRWKRISFLKL